jgi:uncharacterized protein (TIGR03437 family)
MRALLLLVAGFSTLIAQTAFVTGSGYVPPPAMTVAPGQVLTFYVGGLSPTGVSATLSVGSVSQVVDVLSTQATDASTVAVTVLIPFSVAPGAAPVTIQFTGSNGISTDPVNLVVVPVFSHIITTCDTLYGTPTSPCQLAVTHQNGSLVTNSAPAVGGEILSVWAVGLGVPASGIPGAGSGPIAMNDIALNTGFEVVSAGATTPAETQTPYLFAGLSSVTGGLYQVNFAVPQPPAGAQACTQNTEWFTGSGNMYLSIFRPVPFNPSGTTGTAFTLGYFTWSAVGSSVVSSICVTP